MTLITARSPIGKRVERVMLDGQHMRDVVAADVEAGFVDQRVRDEKGNLRRDPNDKSRLLTERRFGRVGLEFRKALPK